MNEPLRVAALVGSLRVGSLNRALYRAAVELAPPTLAIFEAEIRDLPLFDEDIERAGDPPAVVRFKDALAAAEALLIACPEYNQSYPGVLKNAIDWASRSHRGGKVLWGKPAAIMGGAASRYGNVRAVAHLRPVLGHLDVRVMARPELTVVNIGKHIGDDGSVTDEATREQIRDFMSAFADWARIARGPLGEQR